MPACYKSLTQQRLIVNPPETLVWFVHKREEGGMEEINIHIHTYSTAPHENFKHTGRPI